ncbi:MAG TPA: alpha-isopropylmalate synthase regulatory domain-containing protein [Candidatus Binataceae bacterium]|nr:alpha-isopropylmalate synthase regulatory domain-containing protein [Candidatus Binataceae bacterium]
MNTDRQTSFYEAEIPQASRELKEFRTSAAYEPPFEVVRRRIIDDFYEGKLTVDATIVIRIGECEETEAARGVGVVNALDSALRKALLKYFPSVANIKVTETYTHGSGESTEAEVVSVKKFSDGAQSWTTMAKSSDAVEASWKSLVDGYEWRIYTEARKARRAAEHARPAGR